MDLATTSLGICLPHPLMTGVASFLENRDLLRRLRWLGASGDDSLGQLRGSMGLEKTPNPAACERANYVRILQGPRRNR